MSDELQKICRRCRRTLPWSMFYKQSGAQRTFPRSDCKDCHREKVLIYQFGITRAEYDELLAEQNGVCAICHQLERSKNGAPPKQLAVDHDHETGRVRGLVCYSCNIRLAWCDRHLPEIMRYYGV